MQQKTSAFLLVVLSAILQAHSQNTDSSLISVSIDVFGKGAPATTSGLDEYYYRSTITNNRDSAIHFNMMKCSWTDSWFCNNDAIHFYHPGCDANYPIEIALAAHQSLKFYGILTTEKRYSPNKHFKVGFAMLSSQELQSSFYRDSVRPKKKIYWSNSTALKDKLFTFETEQQAIKYKNLL